jgi:hypothetical protein
MPQQTVVQRLDSLDPAEAESVFAALEAAGAEEMRREGVAEDAIEFERRLDLRYVGQSYELTVPAGGNLAQRFHAEHDRVYGFSAESEPIECVSLRLTTIGRIAKPPPRALARGGAPRGEGTPRGVLRRSRRLRRVPDLRPLRARRRRAARRARGRRGVRLDHRRASGLRPACRRPRKPVDREGGSMTTVRESHAQGQTPDVSGGGSGAYGIVVSKDVMVPMRDGILLATDLHRPGRDGELVPGRRPTIVCITPYDKTERRYTEIADFFVPHGYAVVLQDMRDRHRSQGTKEYFHSATPHTGEDGYDTIEWIAASRGRTAARAWSGAPTPASRRSGPPSRARRT